MTILKTRPQINIRHILFTGLILRLLAVYFSRGFAFYDDHFAVIELAQEWHRGNIEAVTGKGVYVFSLLYPGLHYLLISACNFAGIYDPEGIMMVIRLFHALVSLAGIYYAFLLTSRLTNNRWVPVIAALLMAALWIFPFLAVRNLREMFCIPFLLAGSYYLTTKENNYRPIIVAAVFFVLAVCVRLQCAILPAAAAVFLVFKKGALKKALLFGTACAVFFLLTQGLFDWLYYGNPLASTLEYFRYNSNPQNISNYPQGPWYQYIFTIAGILFIIPFIPLMAGYIYSARLSGNGRLLFFSSLLFFLIHSFYANKQERFILPFVPYFLILGITGCSELYHRYKEKRGLQKITRICLVWFIILNTTGLFILTFSYSKRSRVETMNYLRKKQNVSALIIEGGDAIPEPPLFYLGKRVNYFKLVTERSVKELFEEIGNAKIPQPNYIILVGNNNLNERIDKMKSVYPNLKIETVFEPGFLDGIAYKLNPKHNRNETWYIYRTE